MLLLDKWERQALVDRQALIGRVAVEELPSLFEAKVRFDAALNAEPQVREALGSEQMELREALGVA